MNLVPWYKSNHVLLLATPPGVSGFSSGFLQSSDLSPHCISREVVQKGRTHTKGKSRVWLANNYVANKYKKKFAISQTIWSLCLWIHDGARTHNLLFRRQMLCHWATWTCCWGGCPNISKAIAWLLHAEPLSLISRILHSDKLQQTKIPSPDVVPTSSILFVI